MGGPNVLIIGAGVIGLSTGIAALEQFNDSRVTIWTSQVSPFLVSDIAGAIWTPYKVAPQEKADQLAVDTLSKLDTIIRENDLYDCGVYYVDGYRYEYTDGTPENAKPSWIVGREKQFNYSLHLPSDRSSFPNSHLSSEYTHCHRFQVPMVDSSIYMKYLENLFYKKGGSLVRKHLNSIDEVEEFEVKIGKKFDIVINCSGFGSRKLFNDKNVQAVEGQITLIQLPSVGGVDALQRKFYWSFHKTDTGSTYILPRLNNTYVLGGTANPLSDELMEGDPIVSDLTAADIMKRCKNVVPDGKFLDQGKIIKQVTGWRPYRKNGIRLEVALEGKSNRPVVHSYGYGGSGITVSWGAAFEACKLAQEQLGEARIQSRL